MIKKQIDTLYKLMYKIEREKEKTNSHTYEWAAVSYTHLTLPTIRLV